MTDTTNKTIKDEMKNVADLAFALIKELESLALMPVGANRTEIAKALYEFTGAIANGAISNHRQSMHETLVLASDPSKAREAGVTPEEAQAAKYDIGLMVRALLKIEEETRDAPD